MSTYLQLKNRVAFLSQDPTMSLIPDSQFGEFINDAVRDLTAQGWLLPLEEDISIALTASLYRYAVPSGFAYIRGLYMEDSEGDFSIIFPYHHWNLRYDMLTLPVFLEFGLQYQNSEQFLGAASASTQVAQGFQSTYDEHISRVSLPLRREGSPSDNLTLTIETDSSGPSGTPVTNGTSDTVSGSGLQTVLTDPDSWVDFDFDPPAVISAATTYHLVLARSGAVDASDYYAWAIDADGSYNDGAMALHNGTSWQTATDYDALFRLRSPTRAAPLIRFNKNYWSPSSYAGRNVKIVGQRRPIVYVNDGDIIEPLFEAFLRERATALALFFQAGVPEPGAAEAVQALEGGSPPYTRRPGTAEGLFGARQMALLNLARVKYAQSERMLSYHPSELRVKPNSRVVPGR